MQRSFAIQLHFYAEKSIIEENAGSLRTLKRRSREEFRFTKPRITLHALRKNINMNRRKGFMLAELLITRNGYPLRAAISYCTVFTKNLTQSLWSFSSIQSDLWLLYFRQQVHICVPFLYPDLFTGPFFYFYALIHIISYRTKPMHETIPFHSILQRPEGSDCIRKDLIVFGFWFDSRLTFQVITPETGLIPSDLSAARRLHEEKDRKQN